ncbi:response regulator [Pedobacter sp. MC2016-14]|uniref:ATP-binding protein n=1 Tax=Pedobacter sp. MC2016-14 TaxID=2897327 RepID=UPI001E64716F|nr:ATP-binding protein [Pedobacter sp. MC2016-14]MCD0486834.1 response regulator [Pedobacter sp. MC2016-14]
MAIQLNYQALLSDSSVPLMKARIKILTFGLLFLILLCSVLLVILFYNPLNPHAIPRLGTLLAALCFALYLLLVKGKWKISGHMLLLSLCLFMWSNLMLYSHGMNMITFQLILITISASFYILGKNWGIWYAIITVVPVFIRLLYANIAPGEVYITNLQAQRPSFLVAFTGNFILLVLMHYEFFKSFYQSQIKERELNIQLQQALSEAQQATKMRANFLSSMSHELRTPLHAVIGMSNLLSTGHPRKDQEEHLAILRFSAENLMALINDTLDFSKLNADKIVLSKSEFNLQQLLQNIYGSFHSKAKQKGVALLLNTEDEQCPLMLNGDQTRLTQILNNLISNAIKFTDAKGKVEISVKTITKDQNSVLLAFKVSDNGIGIPKNKQTIIFEPFLQADNNIAKRYGGTGLGLAIVKRLVQLHDSNLILESEENKGSTFTFDLRYDFVSSQHPTVAAVPIGPTIIDISQLNILIAEDNLINIMLLKRILDQWNCRYTEVHNGLEALEKAKTGEFDVILMDIHMPVMDGFEAAKLIREVEDVRISQIKIIALTASSEVDIQQSFSYTYLDDYLTKPFSPNLLKEKLEAIVK